jgi:predicted amidohydrolase
MPIHLAAAQYPITRHADFAAWQAHTRVWVEEAVAMEAQILVFPEYGSLELVSLLPLAVQTDVRAQVRALADYQAAFCDHYAALSSAHGLVIIAPSLPVIVEGQWLNRAYVFGPRGLAGYQDKFFMTRFEGEEWGIVSAPKQLSLFEADWGSFGVQTCYDIEFPLGAHILCGAGARLILVPSCTETLRGSARVHVGARARALENQAFVAVSQTVGEATWCPAADLNYGVAAIYSPPDKGLPEEGIVATHSPQSPGWLCQSLDLDLIDAVRADGQVFNHKDQQRLQAGFLGETTEVVRIPI